MICAVGCAPAYTFSASTSAVLTPKEGRCEFAVTTTAPGEAYEEIGALDWMQGHGAATTLAEFKEVVRDQVCKVGASTVVVQVNGSGAYIRGTVIRAR